VGRDESSTPTPMPATKSRGTLIGMRTTRILVSCYLTLSVLTLVAVFLMRDHPGLVNPAVWVRTSIVAASAALMMSFVVRRAYLRLRIVSTVMLIAIAVILAIPGDFPLWLKAEQAICGLLLLGVVVKAWQRKHA
jgi:O-antigen/teichoic acid export membrane protein